MKFTEIDPYFDNKINNLPVLTDEQTKRLFILFHKGSREARKLLILHNVKFVHKIVLGYAGYNMPRVDLAYEGIIGLIVAVEKFDHTKGVEFQTYAVYWIRSYLNKALNTVDDFIRVPENHLLAIRKAYREKTVEFLPEVFKTTNRLRNAGVSMETVINRSNDRSNGKPLKLYDILADVNADNPEEIVIDNSNRKYVKKWLKVLPQREAMVLDLVYGLNQNQPLSTHNISKLIGLSTKGVCQTRDRGLRLIRKHLQRERS